MPELLRFEFTREEDARVIEADLSLAILCAECIHGRPRVRMEISYAVDPAGRSCVLETSGEAGEAVARVLAGLLSTRLGEQAYKVRRMPRDADAAGVGR